MEYSNREVCLYGLEQLALIIKSASKVIYYNQAGGYSCMQPSVEGILIILDDDTKTIIQGLTKYTYNKTKLSHEDADLVDELLRLNRTGFLSMDRSKLETSMEAWLNVTIDYSKVCNGCFSGFTETEGVITWNNSD
ncbi:DUF6210 family protein [Paenibacillus fonticola]|uniref:DUF6210 family protein n=1 Tax=Paenibacillus fonticola TaxID=379896 RepID=UPI00037915B1|nr:DUF6210 family protein [Paenibacillus fonticola]